MTLPEVPQQSNDRLSMLYRLSQTFNSSLDLEEVLNLVMDEVIAATHAERGFVMLKDDEGKLDFKVARGIDRNAIEGSDFQISRSVVERVAESGESVITNDAQLDDRFSGRKSVMLLGLRSILCAPLTLKDRILGVIYVDNRIQAGIFNLDDLDLMNAIGANAAIAIENARLYQVAIEKGRMERELQMARRVQDSLLPEKVPEIAGWEFAALWEPAREVAGDYYDFIVDDDKLGLVIADVTDKGMAAALFMAFTRSIIRASMISTKSPQAGIKQANRLICQESTRGFFVTLFYAQLDFFENKLTYVNAGHNPPLFYRAQIDKIFELTRTGMALGIDEDAQYEQQTVNLDSGDFIFLYTDGITEAFDASNHQFGSDRLKSIVYDYRYSSANQLMSSLGQMVESFTASNAPTDDVTIMVTRKL
jgi:sigma-B regulation protein RsbU (phosphoserine phosphatase)